MATPNPASESPSGEVTKSIPRSDCSPGGDSKCLDTSLDFFFINFCKIRGLASNFQSLEHHLSSTKPHLLFLNETQLSEATDSSPIFVPSYFLYPHFRSKAGCCVLEHILSHYPFTEIFILEISMFTTSFGFPLPPLTILMNYPSTLLSSMI
ncbi:hypothetical protein E2C01_060173 [Portunus trituberculatus]|uniref:Uncharacterized protein n=1 Tax=Portunus trituberculatus TaxID=210409 RepID=A0A5B7H1J0_PORTR|nr:hypothetical protein [Portunus trituberculatus]